MGLAELLASLRTARGLSQAQLAAAASVSVRAIGDLERGTTRRPRRPTVDALASALSLDDDERAALHLAARRHPPPRRAAPRAGPAPAVPLLGHVLGPLLGPLLGRESDVEAVTALIRRAQTRMVTITGPPGVGKTALAHRIVAQAGAGFDRTSAAGVDAALGPDFGAGLGGDLGVRLGPDFGAGLDAAADAIGSTRWLLLIDGADGVPDLAPALADLLTRCPGLTLLVTSRTPLRLRAEHLWPLAGLPSSNAGAAVAVLARRAGEVRPGFALTAGNADALASLADRLGGVPLALELAATALRTRDPAELAAELAGIGADPVAGVVAWTLDGLGEPARGVAHALSALRGGARVESLRAALTDAADHLHASIGALVAAGLVVVADHDGQPRVLMAHPAVRELVAHHLDRPPPAAAAARADDGDPAADQTGST